ncbi:cytochrome c oxidase subunit II [Pistricoccus aurantiacus]|uniref:Cytochrome c oxidase subunit 2 n=1 Tax=Pistricoccus aurantiacus TaxID=1883414 RepID=A0A5B8SUC2_9GAMM|nr:cytochrome c oxidase subunit II [Pistricoccus aurantiacus]QEA39884.1 cytochrome c oxidase subunit II [Pistricoccus aurantiacus]
MHKRLAWGIAVTGGMSPASITLASGWNMPVGVTEVSREIYSLHMLIFWICVVIGVLVFGVMFYSLYRYRRSKGAKAANFHENTVVEIFWTAIPLLILVAMAVPATATLKKMYDASESEIDIMITGHQWRWQYAYLNNEVDFFSNITTPAEQISGTESKTEHYLLEVDQPLVLPIDRKVRLLMTSADVIHSWWVPELGIKKDAVPGYVNEAWVQIDEPGIYRGQCAELCGKNHGFMPAVVKAVEQEEFESWLAAREEETAAASSGIDREWGLDELMERGEQVYNSVCAACHMPDGTGNPPTFPALAGNTELMNDLDRHINTVLNGVSGSAMPAFAGNFNPIELAAVITYERNAWGEASGEVIQPKDIQALLK